MAKDPAFLFYSADFYMGTVGMTDEQVGRYIRLMCLQHQQGCLTNALMLSVMGGEMDPAIMSKFLLDDDGTYYNHRLREESDKRAKYSESRRANRTRAVDGSPVSETYVNHMSNTCTSYVPHMENVNEDEVIDVPTVPKGGTGGKVKPQKHQYGEYKNVLLTDAEMQKLKAEFPGDWHTRIEQLSGYMASKGATYKNHLATIRNWAKRDAEKPQPRPSKEVGAHRYDQRTYTESQLDAGTSDLVAEALRARNG